MKTSSATRTSTARPPHAAAATTTTARKDIHLLRGGIAVLDFGGQYSHLISRRIRDLGVYAFLVPHDTPLEHLKVLKVAGVVLSGGPASVYAPAAPKPDERILRDSIPILGICYGYQLIVQASGGEVVKAASR